jgi:hypothetical protein
VTLEELLGICATSGPDDWAPIEGSSPPRAIYRLNVALALAWDLEAIDYPVPRKFTAAWTDEFLGGATEERVQIAYQGEVVHRELCLYAEACILPHPQHSAEGGSRSARGRPASTRP